MEIKFMILILAAAAFPILILIPAQVFLTLKGKNPVLQGLPALICVLGIMASLVYFPEQGGSRLLAVLYCILLLILCGTGWVIAWSIQKSNRS